MLAFDELLGTAGPDDLRGAADTIVFALGGDDRLSSVGGGADFQVLAGGAGDDTYRAGSGHYVAVFDERGSDRLVLEGFSLSGGDDIRFGFIDGRHLGAVNIDTDSEVYVLEYRESAIATVQLADTTLAFDDLVALLPGIEGFVGEPTWEQLALLGLEDIPTTRQVDDAIATAEAREAELGGGGHGGGTIPGTGEGLSPAEARTVAYLYEGALDRDGAIDREGLNFWIDRREGPVTLGDGRVVPQLSETDLARFFLASPEFEAGFGEALDPSDPGYLSDGAFVEILYRNLLDRGSDAGGFAFWLGQLGRAEVAREDVLLAFVTSAENTADPLLAFVEDLAEVAPGDWAFA